MGGRNGKEGTGRCGAKNRGARPAGCTGVCAGNPQARPSISTRHHAVTGCFGSKATNSVSLFTRSSKRATHPATIPHGGFLLVPCRTPGS